MDTMRAELSSIEKSWLPVSTLKRVKAELGMGSWPPVMGTDGRFDVVSSVWC